VDELNSLVQGKSLNIKEIQDKFKNLKQMSNSLLQTLKFFKL
jgi:hypothetical protein